MVEGRGGERRTLCPKRASCSSDGVGSSPSVPLPKHSLQAVGLDLCQRDVEDDGRGRREAEEAGEGKREGMPDLRGTSRGSSGLDCPWSDRRFPRQALPCRGRRVSRVGGGGEEHPCVEKHPMCGSADTRRLPSNTKQHQVSGVTVSVRSSHNESHSLSLSPSVSSQYLMWATHHQGSSDWHPSGSSASSSSLTQPLPEVQSSSPVSLQLSQKLTTPRWR
jgi:hypothetical protein